jgi:hypothetical protein
VGQAASVLSVVDAFGYVEEKSAVFGLPTANALKSSLISP